MRKCRTPNRCWVSCVSAHTAQAAITGEPDDRETITSGSAGGRAEKGLPSRHLAARPTHLPGISKRRRCVRDYETLPEHHEAVVHIAMIMTMSRRLARTT